MKLRFDGKGVARCLSHATQSKTHTAAFMNEPQAGLFLVHDSGVYLMSTGVPGDRDGMDPKGPCFVVYAEGCDPGKDPDCYDTARLAVGGDDFGELIPLTEFIEPVIKGLANGRYDLEIEMEPATFTMNLVRRRTPCRS